MYEKHFGLSKNPFQSIAEGEAVFEGPAQAKVISDLKTALSAKDSIAVITGPVGVGKTTIVQRALEQSGPDRLVAILGRIQVSSDELVDLLLAQFGAARESGRRFECLETFERILNEKAQAGARVFIVIEDAERLGAELLEELEALTAADGSTRAGANIILMGPQKLDKLITTPALERARQRIRLQQTLERFTAEEVEAYLRHRINVAGGDFDAIFEQGAPLMVRRCSGGIPRVINSLCETALTVAAENNVSQVSGKIVFKVAVEVFGMAPGHTPVAQAPKAAPATKPMAPPAVQPTPAAQQAAAPTAPAPTEEKIADPTIPARTLPAAAENKPAPQQASAPRAPKPPANVQKAPAKPDASNGAAAPAAAESKPATDQPSPAERPKFVFADEIIVDRDTRPNLHASQLKDVDPPAAKKDKPKQPPKPAATATKPAPAPAEPVAAKPAPAPAEPAAAKPAPAPAKPAAAKPAPAPANPVAAKPAPAAANPAAAKPAPAAANPAAAKPAPAPANPAPDKDVPTLSVEDPDPPASGSDSKSDEATASFAKVDHDMLDAALASLAVHDEEDEPEAEEQAPAGVDSLDVIPEVTLDKSIEDKRAKAAAATDPAELDRMAAELEKTKSLEEMSDQLAETLFGSEELESISLQIREDAAPEEENSVVLEPVETTGAAEPAPAPEPKAAPNSLPAPKPATNIEIGTETAAPAAPPPQQRGPQPEPIENQFNSSMTATLKTLNKQGKPAEDDDSEENSGGLLGRLKDTFKS